jgi:PHP family Zn ribbon phosphoesterase
MIPPMIIEEVKSRGINLIAITDHNASANVAAVQKAAIGSDVVVLSGMELQTREEVHVLCLFDRLEQVLQLQSMVDLTLPDFENRIEHFGEQFVVDETGDFIRRETRLLISSTNISLNQAWQKVTELGGLLIPAHIDRRAFGLIAVLGMIPVDIPLCALELSRHISPKEALQKFPQLANYPLIQSGDVHRLDEFLGVNIFQMEEPTIDEIKMALYQSKGRSHQISI